jgi:hypothetical protein
VFSTNVIPSAENYIPEIASTPLEQIRLLHAEARARHPFVPTRPIPVVKKKKANSSAINHQQKQEKDALLPINSTHPRTIATDRFFFHIYER